MFEFDSEADKMRVKKSLFNIISGVFGQLVLLITGFITRTIFIRVLGTTYLGVSGLFSNILTVFSFAELGIGQAIIFNLYKPIADKDEEKICSLMDLYAKVYKLLFVIILIIGILLIPFLKYLIKDINSIDNIVLIYVLYLINSASSYLFTYRSSFLTACQENYIVNIVNFVGNIIMSIVQVIGLLFFKNYIVYLLSQILFIFLQNLFIYYYSSFKYDFLKRKDVKKLSDDELNKIKKDVSALILYKVGTISLNSTDNIIISSFVGLSTVGLYSNYLLLQTSVTGFLSTIFNNLTASIGNLNAKEKTEKKLFIFNVINLLTFWLYAICSICLFNCMNPFISLWIGNDYLLPLSVSFIMCFNVYIAGMLFAPFNYRQTMGLFVQGKYRPVITAILNIVISIILVKQIGLIGVLWGTAISRLLTNVWFDPYLVFKKGLDTNPFLYYKDYIFKAVLLFCMGILAYFLTSFIPNSNILYVLARAVITFLVTNIVLLIVYRKTEEFKYLKNIFDKILRKNL